MIHPSEDRFESVESAHEYVKLLAEVVAHARQEVASDVEREGRSGLQRRLETLRLLTYNLEKLEQHLKKSSRLLNDVRSLRRLLFQERSEHPVTVQKK